MHVLAEQPLLRMNTLALDGRARALLRLEHITGLEQALGWAADRQLPVVPLGEGSNIVVAGDVEALVLRLATSGIEVLEEDAEKVHLRVAAGENWHRLVEWTLRRGYFGLENLALIPGTVGAAPVQNIGAYGVELASFVRAVHSVELATGAGLSLSREACEFGYRDSVFKNRLRDKMIITSVELELSREPHLQFEYPALAAVLEGKQRARLSAIDVFDAVVAIRRSKLPDPARVPNAGSFFKNPVVDAQRAGALARQFPGMWLEGKAAGWFWGTSGACAGTGQPGWR